MFETGFFGLFDGLGFLGGVICALLLIGLCIFTLLTLVVTTVERPILFVIVTAVYWFCVIKFTSICIWHIVIYGIYFIMWLLFICGLKNDEEFKKEKKTPTYLTILTAFSFIMSIFLVS